MSSVHPPPPQRAASGRETASEQRSQGDAGQQKAKNRKGLPESQCLSDLK